MKLILINISLNFVPEGSVVKKSALVEVMNWCWTGDKPLRESKLPKMSDDMAWLGHNELMFCPIKVNTEKCWSEQNGYHFMTAWCKFALIVLMSAIDSLWPRNTIWRHRSGSTLVQVMACCLTAPSHYLNQCWLIISKVQRHSAERNLTRNNPAISH